MRGAHGPWRAADMPASSHVPSQLCAGPVLSHRKGHDKEGSREQEHDAHIGKEGQHTLRRHVHHAGSAPYGLGCPERRREVRDGHKLVRQVAHRNPRATQEGQRHAQQVRQAIDGVFGNLQLSQEKAYGHCEEGIGTERRSDYRELDG